MAGMAATLPAGVVSPLSRVPRQAQPQEQLALRELDLHPARSPATKTVRNNTGAFHLTNRRHKPMGEPSALCVFRRIVARPRDALPTRQLDTPGIDAK